MRCATSSRGSRPRFDKVPHLMGFAATTFAALALWIILWAIGAKPIDAFLPAVAIILVAATVRMLGRYLARQS